MELYIQPTPESLGNSAGRAIAESLNAVIAARGAARLLLSTGASQFETLAALVSQPVDWRSVTLFHLDEYVGLTSTHPASFRKYLQERFVSQLPVPLGKIHFVTGEDAIPALSEAVRAQPIDVGVIGIGENGHIAFNDPPADFDTRDAYRVVTLDARCRGQQVGEGWFASMAEVPEKAISMTVHQILQAKKIISCVPHAVKAQAVRDTLMADAPTPLVPASMLMTHPDWTLYLDDASAALCDRAALAARKGVRLHA